MKKISVLLAALTAALGIGGGPSIPRRYVERERAPLKGTRYHRKVPKTDADRVRCALAAERRAERGARRLGWAIDSNANQRCTRSHVGVVGCAL